MQKIYSFPAKLKIKKNNEIKQLFRQKKIAQNSLVIFSKQNNLSYPRLAVTITKKNIRTAVARNRIKRIIKESFRLHQNIIQGFDVIVKVYKEAGLLTNKEISQCLKKLWEKLSLSQDKY
jgi:ribonuclease P protein component